MELGLGGTLGLVTGGSRGIGAAIALELAKEGVDVAITFRKNVGKAKEVASKIEKLGRRSLPVQVNASSFSGVQEAVKKVIERFGGLDILVNNAGINRDGVIWKLTEEQWDAVINVNLKGYFNHIRAVAPLFKNQGSGKIVNITSINGLRGKFGQSNYSASKAGIIGLTKSVAKELARYNVNVNAVAPGMIATEMYKQAPEEAKQRALSEILLGRVGKPEDVARVVVFLCSDAARHITGEVIKVDGGQYI